MHEPAGLDQVAGAEVEDLGDPGSGLAGFQEGAEISLEQAVAALVRQA